MLKEINKIFKILEKKRKQQFKLLVILMFFCVIVETIGISSMIPLISYFTGAEILLPFNLDLSLIPLKFGFTEDHTLNFILIFIVAIFLFKNMYVAFYHWIESKYAYRVRFGLGVRLFRHYLYSPYLFHLSNNSSSLMSKIIQETSVYGHALIHLSTLITEILVIIGLTTFLFIIKPLETSIVVSIGFITSLVFYIIFRNIITRLGKKREIAQRYSYKSLQQGLGAIKDVIFYKVQKSFINIFRTHSDDMAEVIFKIHFLQRLPRIWLEIIAVIVMACVIFLLASQRHDIGSILATVGLFLLVALRIIPSINRILTSVQSLKFSEPALDAILKDLEKPNLIKTYQRENINDEFNFQKEIKFNGVTFEYKKNGKKILQNINLTIKKNEFVGIIGETGAGKSTFVDMLIGLIEPTSGTITVDGKDINDNLYSWKKNLGYVPQNFYLLDDSIKNNIAFGSNESEITKTRIESSINKSQLTDFVNNLDKGFESNIGELGVNISGGEKQRIAIARSLYNEPNILIFDEATSSLDLDTERKILNTLVQFKKIKTVLIISHRDSSLKICDKIFKIQNKEIKEI